MARPLSVKAGGWRTGRARMPFPSSQRASSPPNGCAEVRTAEGIAIRVDNEDAILFRRRLGDRDDVVRARGARGRARYCSAPWNFCNIDRDAVESKSSRQRLSVVSTKPPAIDLARWRARRYFGPRKPIWYAKQNFRDDAALRGPNLVTQLVAYR